MYSSALWVSVQTHGQSVHRSFWICVFFFYPWTFCLILLVLGLDVHFAFWYWRLDGVLQNLPVVRRARWLDSKIDTLLKWGQVRLLLACLGWLAPLARCDRKLLEGGASRRLVWREAGGSFVQAEMELGFLLAASGGTWLLKREKKGRMPWVIKEEIGVAIHVRWLCSYRVKS